MLPTPFPLARYRFEAEVETPLHLPEYAGSALRGAFGNALRRTACMTREKECKPCPLYRGCPYPAIFQPPPPAEHSLQKFTEIPAPFLVEPPPWGERDYAPGETLEFHLVLAGRALDQLPLIVFAWQRALKHGIGRGDGTARLLRVWLESPDEDRLVYDAQDGKVAEHVAILPPPPAESACMDRISLRFTTPLRLQQDGRPLRPGTLTPRAFLMALTRRVALVCEFHLGHRLELDFHDLGLRASAVESDMDLTWRDWTRYSSRQKQEMVLGGCVGTWTLRGDLTLFLPFLHVGRWLHAGKNASFGLGQYSWLQPG